MVEESFEENVNCFVHAVGEGHLRSGEAEMRGDDGFNGLTLGIAREAARGDVAEHCAHLGRTGQRVLVEVETECVAAAERRVIFLHRLYAGAGQRIMRFDCFSHGISFSAAACGWLRRGR